MSEATDGTGSKIEQALDALFKRHRIVLWNDTQGELRAEFDAAAIDGVEKIVLANNEFGVKLRVLRREPARKFLIYSAEPPPADADNWLLDVQLAHATFRADRSALILAELGLPPEFEPLVLEHGEFFRAAPRVAALSKGLAKTDSMRQVRLKMVAVCVAAHADLEEIVGALLAELANSRDDGLLLLRRCQLEPFLWQSVQAEYGYTSTAPGVRDFVLALFAAGNGAALGQTAALSVDALLFLRHWKDSESKRASFRTLSAQAAQTLGIEQELEKAKGYRALLDNDLFEMVDQRILSGLVRDVTERTIGAAEVSDIVDGRRKTHWYATYRDGYEAAERASQLLALVDTLDLSMGSLEEGVTQYTQNWQRVDQLYRQFTLFAQRAAQNTLLGDLQERVENHYTNKFLLRLNDRWQERVDACQSWPFGDNLGQDKFFEKWVHPYLARNNKVFIVISDALRYEIGDELLRLIRQEDRFDGTIEVMISMLPSYTQLGMAALLPGNEPLEVDATTGTVRSGALGTAGLENRRKLLESALPGRTHALKTEEFMALTREESRALIRETDVIYLYHNVIDAVGDKLETEDRTFEAADRALDELVKIVKKLANANANNLLITADHGFIYQHGAIDESDFSSVDAEGDEITYRNRRFVLGRGLQATPSFKHFTAAAVGLGGDLEMLIPKSINRLRLKGAGSRYVHGGAALQEVVVPVLAINKKRETDLSKVNVEVLRGNDTIISTGQLMVRFLQMEPVSEKVQKRVLRAGLYTREGVLLSDEHTLQFDSTAEDGRKREQHVRFVLSKKAQDANNQTVFLRLEEPEESTTFFKTYVQEAYSLRRSFTSDFDL